MIQPPILQKEQFEGDWERALQMATNWPTAVNTSEVYCRECNGTFYVDPDTSEQFKRALEFDPADNRFVCDSCEQRFEAQLYER